MPVKVTLSNTDEINHDKAQAIAVRDGHLIVLSSPYNNANTLAIYAPARWLSATAELNAASS